MATLPRTNSKTTHHCGWINIKVPGAKSYRRYFSLLQDRELALFTNEEKALGYVQHVEDRVPLSNILKLKQKDKISPSHLPTICLYNKFGKEIKIRADTSEEHNDWFRFLHTVALLQAPNDGTMLPGEKFNFARLANELSKKDEQKFSRRFSNYELAQDVLPQQNLGLKEEDEKQSLYADMRIGKHTPIPTPTKEHPPVLQKMHSQDSFVTRPQSLPLSIPTRKFEIELSKDMAHSPIDSYTPPRSIPKSSTEKSLPALPEDIYTEMEDSVFIPEDDKRSLYVDMRIGKHTPISTPTKEHPPVLQKMHSQDSYFTRHQSVPLSIPKTRKFEIELSKDMAHSPIDSHTRPRSIPKSSTENPLPALPEEIYTEMEDNVFIPKQPQVHNPTQDAGLKISHGIFLEEPLNRKKAETILQRNQKFGNLMLRRRGLSRTADQPDYAVSIRVADITTQCHFKHFCVSEKQLGNRTYYTICLGNETLQPVTSLEKVVDYFVSKSDGQYKPLEKVETLLQDNVYDDRLPASSPRYPTTNYEIEGSPPSYSSRKTI